MRQFITFIFIYVSLSVFGQVVPADEISPFSNTSNTQMYKGFIQLNANDSYLESGGPVNYPDSSFYVEDITYTNTYHEDLRVPLTNTRISPAKSEPVFEDMGDGIFSFGFDADADSTEFLNFIAQVPHEWASATDLDAHIHWTPSTTNTGNVKWKLQYKMFAIGDTIMTINTLRVVDAADGVTLKHQLADFGDIPGDSLGISAIIIGGVARCGEDAADTYTGTAYGLEIDFHYEISSPGSREEYVK